MFQSTHLREVRLFLPAFLFAYICFNPRTYERCDNNPLNVAPVAMIVSIHAPTRGATERAQSYCSQKGFNPRTYERCD